METYDKQTAASYELVVVSSLGACDDYFMRNCQTVGFPQQLDFRWVKRGKTKASITFAISEILEAVSLPQSPFGGIWIEDSISSSALEEFIHAFLNELGDRGISTVKIVQPPKPYEPNFDLINHLLFKRGFEQQSLLSHQFFIGRKKIKKLVQSESSKYAAKAKDLGLKIQAGPIQSFGFLQEIKNWNQQRGYDILFDDDRLIGQVSNFPERYFLISIYKGENALAHVLGVKLLSDSLYYFLSATLPKSTIKNLGEIGLFHLFQFASNNRLNFIDLGSSDTVSGVNHNLMFFKSRFSNDISSKVTWILKLR